VEHFTSGEMTDPSSHEEIPLNETESIVAAQPADVQDDDHALRAINKTLLHRVQLLEQELVDRNKECSTLRTEHRVMQSYNTVLKATQGELLRLQKTCVELQNSNADMALKLREIEAARSKAEHKEKMNALRRRLDEPLHSQSSTLEATPSSSLHQTFQSPSAAVGLGQQSLMGGIVPTTYGSEVLLAPTAISSLGFANSSRNNTATQRQQEPPQHQQQLRPPQPYDETDEVNHLMSMVGDAAAHDATKQQMDMDDEDELLTRFAALQRRK
jgi:hypothetical protein